MLCWRSEVWPLYESSLNWSSCSLWNKREWRRRWGGRGISERDGRERAAGRKRGAEKVVSSRCFPTSFLNRGV